MFKSMHRLTPLLFGTLLAAATSATASTEECIPAEQEELIEGLGPAYGVANPSGNVQGECEESQPHDPPLDDGPQAVFSIPPAERADELFAVDLNALQPNVASIVWLAHLVATDPVSAPQVLQIGLRRTANGVVLVARGADGVVVHSTQTLPLVDSNAVFAVSRSSGDEQPGIMLGGPGAASIRWPVPARTTVTFTATAGAAEPALVSLGAVDR